MSIFTSKVGCGFGRFVILYRNLHKCTFYLKIQFSLFSVFILSAYNTIVTPTFRYFTLDIIYCVNNLCLLLVWLKPELVYHSLFRKFPFFFLLIISSRFYSDWTKITNCTNYLRKYWKKLLFKRACLYKLL